MSQESLSKIIMELKVEGTKVKWRGDGRKSCMTWDQGKVRLG